MTLLSHPPIYKPFSYPWAYEAWYRQQKIHWLAEEIPLHDDVQDWHGKLTASERNLLTQIFRFFTQADIDVNNCYMTRYAGIFQPVEVTMMLAAFSNTETIHVQAYSHLLDTIGMPEIEYQAFMKYHEMKSKCDYLAGFSVGNKYEIAKTLATFGAFAEGMQLFSSFAILLSFPRRGRMKGMGQIITYSVRDETLHCLSIIQLFRTFVHENPEIWTKRMQREIMGIAEEMVDHEDAFITLAFQQGDIDGLTAAEVRRYIRFITDRRLIQLGLSPIFQIGQNPLPWLDEMLNAIEHMNFFEGRATEYSRASTTGTWEEAFAATTFSDGPVNMGECV